MFERHAPGLQSQSEHYLAEFVDARDPGMVVSIMKLEGAVRISYPIKETVPVLQFPNIMLLLQNTSGGCQRIMRIANIKIVAFWQALLLLSLLCWAPFSLAQPEARLRSSLHMASPEKPYTVQVGVQIDQIAQINQKAENFQIVGNLRFEWDEPKLEFDATEHGRNFKQYTVDSFAKYVDEHGIFAPGFLIQNQQGRRFTQGAEIAVFNNGHSIYFERFTVTLQAPEFDFIQYPFDSQKFYLHVDAVMPAGFVRYEPLEEYSQLGDQLGEEEWTIERSWTTTDEVAGVTGLPTSRFTFGIEASRHLSFYFLRIFLPLVIIILVSWFTFFLKDYAKRVDMAVANLLVFVAFNFTISNDLPRLGYLTFIDAIMFTSFMFTGLVVLVNVVFRRMEDLGRESLARRLDNYTILIYPITLVALVAASWVRYIVY